MLHVLYTGLRVQEFESPPSNESTVVGIDQDGSEIQLPLEIFKRVGQTGRLDRMNCIWLTVAVLGVLLLCTVHVIIKFG